MSWDLAPVRFGGPLNLLMLVVGVALTMTLAMGLFGVGHPKLCDAGNAVLVCHALNASHHVAGTYKG